MPLVEVSANLEATLRASRRWLINGPPNSGKTGSVYTAKGPVIAITLPQEKGDASMPLTTRDGKPIKSFKFDIDPAKEGVSWAQEVEAVRRLIREISAGKHGACSTLFLDGAHKLYDTIFKGNCGGSVKNIEEKAVGRKYGESHSDFQEFLDLANRSPVPYVIWTCWDGVKVDSEVDKVTKDSPRSVYVGLPGAMGRKVMGEFSFVLHSFTMGQGTGKQFKWRLEPQGDIESAGRKIRRDLVDRIKLDMIQPQDFEAFDKVLTDEISKAWQETQGGAK
mgnify:FL=1